jgi:hypothetical protein
MQRVRPAASVHAHTGHAALIERREYTERDTDKFLLGSGSTNESTAKLPDSPSELPSVVADDDANKPAAPLEPFFKPNLTISLVNEFQTHSIARLQPQMRDEMDVNKTSQRYYPIVQISEFWLLQV